MTLGFCFFFQLGVEYFFVLLIMEYFLFFLSELHVHFYMPYTITSTVFCVCYHGRFKCGGGGDEKVQFKV